MSIKGSPYPRFRRALETRNLTLIRAAAAELPQVALDHALVICEVLAEQEPEKYERAAVRWLGGLCHERPVTLSELGETVVALEELPQEPGWALAVLRESAAAEAGVRSRSGALRYRSRQFLVRAGRMP